MQLTFPSFDEAEIEMLRQCLDSKWVTQGPLTQQFEALMAARHQVGHALATTSCTAALHLAVLALGLGPGDEVIVPAFTWVTSAYAAEYVGARVVFADVQPQTYNIDPEALAAAITPRTRAVVAVHLFGLAADMEPIMVLARRHGLAVIEDAACAVGSEYAGKPVGGFGDLGCFSFHPRKVITTGEGGLVTTYSDGLAERVRSLRNHGSTGLPSPDVEPHGPWTMATFDRVGYNLRLSDIQAAVGIAQMAKLDRLLSERRACAQRYHELLSDVDELIVPSAVPNGSVHSYQSYVVRLVNPDRARRNQLMLKLKECGVETRPGTHAVHRLGYYRDRFGYVSDDFPVAAASEDGTITLPIFPCMTIEDQTAVVTALKQGLRRTGGFL